MPFNEADTCRIYVTPKLQTAGWETSPHSIHEQKVFTDGRVFTTTGKPRRGKEKRADYVLNYTRDFMIAVVEAKPEDDSVGTGMQQAKDYAEILGLKFAYATNGKEILEFDYTTGQERELSSFPMPEELWRRLTTAEGMSEETARRLLTPAYLIGIRPRYYQEIAINRAVQAILQGKRRLLFGWFARNLRWISPASVSFYPALGSSHTVSRDRRQGKNGRTVRLDESAVIMQVTNFDPLNVR